jgi:hypothetical protein
VSITLTRESSLTSTHTVYVLSLMASQIIFSTSASS